jgi:predicted enzyme related to lactoylglutathione lyase
MAKAAKKKKKAKAKKAAKKALKRTAKKSAKKAAKKAAPKSARKAAKKPAKKAVKKAAKPAAQKAPPPPPPQPVMVHGVFCHVEIPADDVSASRQFYNQVFGWSFQDFPMEQGIYAMYQTRQGGIGGGITTPPPGAPKSIVNYILVDEIEPVLEQILSRGGDLMLPKTQVADMGWMALFTDPSGNVLGLWKTNMSR